MNQDLTNRRTVRAACSGLLACSLLGAAPILLGFVLFGVTGHDDSHIAYSAAERLADSGALVLNDGTPGEQASSLLWVLVLALVHVTTKIDVPSLGWGLALVFSWLLAARVLAFERRLGRGAAARLVGGSVGELR